jgi:hypothetical protein
LVSIATKLGLALHQMDVKTAFLNGVLDRKIFMEIPDGIVGKDELKENYICELKKSLYGLKISPRRWYERFKEVMIKLGFCACSFIC